MVDSVDWTDIDSLTHAQMSELMDVVFDLIIQKRVQQENDPKAFIIYDFAKQSQLFDRLGK